MVERSRINRAPGYVLATLKASFYSVLATVLWMGVFPPFYRWGNWGSWNDWLQALLIRGGVLLWRLLSLQTLSPCSSHTGASGLGLLLVLCLSNLNKSPRVNSSSLAEFLELMTVPGSVALAPQGNSMPPLPPKNYIGRVIKSLLSAGKRARHWSGYQPFCSTRLFTSSNRVSASCHLHHIS